MSAKRETPPEMKGDESSLQPLLFPGFERDISGNPRDTGGSMGTSSGDESQIPLPIFCGGRRRFETTPDTHQ